MKDKKMFSKKIGFSSATDDWSTPNDIFNLLNKEFNFTIDVCADDNNAKCAKYWTEEDDALQQDWSGEICFMNPPYGRDIGKFMQKALDESKKDNTKVVCLIPARTDTRWWWETAQHGEVRLLKGRLKFGNSQNSAPFASAIIVFEKDIEPSIIHWNQKEKLETNG